MALSWGTPTKIIDNTTAAAEAETSQSTAVDLESCVGVVGFSVQCTFNASATAGAVFKVYPSYDGTNYADTPVEKALIEKKDLGNPSEEHVYFPISCRKMKVSVENLDAAQSLTAISVWAHKQTYEE